MEISTCESVEDIAQTPDCIQGAWVLTHKFNGTRSSDDLTIITCFQHLQRTSESVHYRE
ncbi:hypothetical protein PLICRDRAFT_50581 [Plicaturopsis crispa FD-325 SS-3]|nr:hypothetical protein PLICRDRAFT_50581 [Plicaturopsis crispa FD-325 SS-3]